MENFRTNYCPHFYVKIATGKGKVYLEGEHLLLRELLTMEPNSFSNDISGFDIPYTNATLSGCQLNARIYLVIH